MNIDLICLTIAVLIGAAVFFCIRNYQSGRNYQKAADQKQTIDQARKDAHTSKAMLDTANEAPRTIDELTDKLDQGKWL